VGGSNRGGDRVSCLGAKTISAVQAITTGREIPDPSGRWRNPRRPLGTDPSDRRGDDDLRQVRTRNRRAQTHSTPPQLIAVSLIWGFTVVADSAQFSTILTEVADQAHVGTALTLQLAIGFILTVATIWLVPILRDGPGWGWAFVLLVPGPFLGVVAMLRLRSLPEAAPIADGRG